MRIDKIDLAIIEILLRAATTPKAKIARLIGTAASAIFERIRRLEAGGIIRRYETRLDARKLGYDTLAFISITERKPTGGVDTGELLAGVNGVEEVYKIAGRDCFLVKIRARDTEALGEILDNEIASIPTVAETATTIVLKTIKEDVALGGLANLQENAGDLETGSRPNNKSRKGSNRHVTNKNHLQLIDIRGETRDIRDDWKNFVLTEVNDHVVRVSVLDRDFHWHVHTNSDETFLVIDGELFIDLEDRTETLRAGQLFTVPKNIRHRTRANGRVVNLTFEHRNADARGNG